MMTILHYSNRLPRDLALRPPKVPTIFIGEQYWEGYTDQIEMEIREAVDTGLKDGSTDKVAAIIGR